MNGGAPARQRIALVVPALDEEAALPSVLAELPADTFDLVCVVDNGSRDRTSEVARTAGAHVVLEPRRGYGSACQAGILAAREALEQVDVLAFVDADHSDYPEDLLAVLAPVLERRAELSIGSRTLSATSRAAMLPQARFGNRLACFLMRVLFGARHTDLGPMRAIRADALEHLRMADPNFGWTIEMQLKAQSAGLRTVEVPVRYRRRTGRSKVTGTVSGALGAGFKILGWIGAWRLATLTPASRRRIPTYRGR